MKSFALKLIKFLFIFSLVVLFVLFLFAMVFLLKLPWWVGVILLILSAGIYLSVYLLSKIWKRRKEQRFIQQIIEQDEDRYRLGREEKIQTSDLQEHWKAAIKKLKDSPLKHQGDPLRILPWYLIIGESGAGKTTAIKSAGLSAPFTEITRTSGVSGTKNCDWWFSDDAIILDTAGRFAIPVDPGPDRDEWEKFLDLLAKYRKKEPLNGVVVTVAADKLLRGSKDELEDDGLQIRRRIEALIRKIGARFPVYFLITKCDQVHGMTQFCDELSEENLKQAMGYVNHDFSLNADVIADRAISTISNRLKELRLILVHKAKKKGRDPRLILFPEEFERLKIGLDYFIKGFQKRVYQESPILRGIYFSSGRQEGSPFSHFLNNLGLLTRQEVLPGTDRGLFLNDFFTQILPKDRQLFTWAPGYLQWKRLMHNLGLAAWVAIMLAFCGLLGFAFVKNLGTLSIAHEKLSVCSTSNELDRMFCLREGILVLEEKNNWWTPNFGLNKSKNVEIKLKESFCQKYEERLLYAHNQKMEVQMNGFDAYTPEERVVTHLNHLTGRIRMLRAEVLSRPLKIEPAPFREPLYSDQNDDEREKMDKLYSSYLKWQKPEKLKLEIDLLARILTKKGTSLEWLINWANGDLDLSADHRQIRLKRYWKGSKRLDDEYIVPPAFTKEGKSKIDNFLHELTTALGDQNNIVSDIKGSFAASYRRQYLGSWESFVEYFSKGRETLRNRKEWQTVAEVAVSDEGPYFKLINDLVEELDPLDTDDQNDLLFSRAELPNWMDLVYQIYIVKIEMEKEKQKHDKSLLDKLTNRISTLRRLKKMAPKKEDPKFEEAKKYLEVFISALNDVSLKTESRLELFHFAVKTFRKDQDAPFNRAHHASSIIRRNLRNPHSDVFWNIFNGPFSFLWAYNCMEAGCYLQEKWEKDVIFAVKHINDPLVKARQLFGDAGYANAFVEKNDNSALFLERVITVNKDYEAKTFLNNKIAFRDDFFDFISQGKRVRDKLTDLDKRPGTDSPPPPPPPEPLRTDYEVFIRAQLPETSGQNIVHRPRGTRLTLICGQKVQILEDVNIFRSLNFAWSSSSCTDVKFEILFPNDMITLTKTYRGGDYGGFPLFLRDFKGGIRRFSPNDFPNHSDRLRRMGIESITAKYELGGDYALVRDIRKPAPPAPPPDKTIDIKLPKIPEKIISCW